MLSIPPSPWSRLQMGIPVQKTSAGLGDQAGDEEKWPQWTSAVVTVVGPTLCCLLLHLGTLLACYNNLYSKTLPCSASPVLLKRSLGVCKNHLTFISQCWGEIFALAGPYSCLFKMEPRTPWRCESKPAWCLSVGRAVWLARVKNVAVCLASRLFFFFFWIK